MHGVASKGIVTSTLLLKWREISSLEAHRIESDTRVF